MDEARRKLLLSALCGTGWLGLRALATGLPVGLLAAPLRARAAVEGECHAVAPQRLILITSAGGEPLNANVPGCYGDTAIYHPAAATMAATDLTIGGVLTKAAKPWADLSPDLLARTCFFHHATYSAAHGDAAKVNALMGAVKRQELLVSLIAKNTAPCLATTQFQPLVLSQNLITYAGAVLPVLTPSALRNVLGNPAGVLGTLRSLRDADLDRLNALYKQDGTAAQRALLDEFALSQQQARGLSAELLKRLDTIRGSSREDLNSAAVVLLKMNVSPVVVMTYSFGGDNHSDGGLAQEARETVLSVTALADLVAKLKDETYDLYDSTTIVFQGVFGRTLNAANRGGNANGRDHNATHHCSVLIGKNVRSSLIGGVTANGHDFRAQGIDSATGSASATGDVPYEATLAAVGKTVAAAVGVERAVIDDQITAGKVISPALVA